jgi:hypothetical protein
MVRFIAVSQASLAVVATCVTGTSVNAQQGTVANACKEDIATYCADKPNAHGEARACLQANRNKISDVCKMALDTTGPVKGTGEEQRPQEK